MPSHEFENYLALVSRLMRLNRSQTESIRQELRDHLETRVSELVESGVDVIGATRRALEEFGDAAVLAQEFQGIFQLTRRRWMMRFATFSIVGTFLAAVLIMSMWPSAARFGAPNSSIAQDVSDSNGDDEGDQTDAFQIGSIDLAIANAQPERMPRRTIWSFEDVDRKLQQPVDFDFVETPMIEVLDMIRDEYGFNVLLDESARADLDEDTLITFQIKDVRLSAALRWLLNKHNATYVVQDGILRLISLDVVGDPVFFRRKMFDCRELLASINKAEPERIGTPIGFKLPERQGGSVGPSGGVFNQVSSLSGPSKSELFSDGLDQRPALGHSDSNGVGELPNTRSISYIDVRQEGAAGSPSNDAIPESSPSGETDAVQTASSHRHAQQMPAEPVIVQRVTAESILTDLIKTSVDPESWDSANGDGTLSIVGGFMVVIQTQETLDEIGDLINELEERMKRDGTSN